MWETSAVFILSMSDDLVAESTIRLNCFSVVDKNPWCNFQLTCPLTCRGEVRLRRYLNRRHAIAFRIWHYASQWTWQQVRLRFRFRRMIEEQQASRDWQKTKSWLFVSFGKRNGWRVLWDLTLVWIFTGRDAGYERQPPKVAKVFEKSFGDGEKQVNFAQRYYHQSCQRNIVYAVRITMTTVAWWCVE